MVRLPAVRDGLGLVAGMIRRPAYAKPAAGLKERAVQRSIITICELMHITAVHVPNGAMLAGDRIARAKQMAVLKADGLRPGFPDLLLIDELGRERAGFLEVKRERGGIASEVQIGWGERLEGWGFRYALIDRAEDLPDIIKEWGWR